ncbi:universal stress protein [Phenylobacterium aquaticum]|uniref:universal stress protein n=1 Tax=Phenylobacterium aquaticum TaxID=1763816 RepID=UPI001F5D8961|nr:universal stress protein [Phenylobacterium aquaticum]MCI3130903.1 universal stress protein [Phenylobacterium aquaticum]
MSYKTILVHLEPTPASEARLQAAVEFAGKLDAELIGLGGRASMIQAAPLAMAEGGSYAVEAWAEDEARSLAEVEATFRRLGGGATWRAVPDYPTDAMCDNAAGVDLIITGLERAAADFAPDAADTVLRAGLPVIALPAGHPQIGFERIVVAWKDTREARRAVSDALPLLRRAGEVAIVSVSTHSGAAATPASIDNLISRLARHGVNAVVEPVSTRRDPADKLISFATSRRADLIVSGAFGHSKAGEWLLGGMTQTLLECSPLPVLFSH